MIIHERRASAPPGFVKVSAAPGDQSIPLRLGLAQSNIQGLEEQLMAVSTPSSAQYGQFLTKEQVEAYVAPSQATVDALNAFLSSNNISAAPASPAGDILAITITVSQANELFSTSFDTYKNSDTGAEAVRTLEYSIPATLKGHLEFVHPTTLFPQSLKKPPVVMVPLPKSAVSNSSSNASGAIPSSCEQVITPACLQALYGIPSRPATQKSNTIAVAGYIDEYANEADLKTFLSKLRPDISPATTFTLHTLDGGQNDQSIPGVEADLDIQYTVGVATDVPVGFFSVGDSSQDGVFGFLDLANLLLGLDPLPGAFTTSYGSNEPEIPAAIARNLCNAYLQLGVRGTSVFYSSGDGGVSGTQPEQCTTFVPSFPSGCPYLTSVGATTGIPEVAADFSSGGFSNVFPRPAYQELAVTSYLARLGKTYAGLFNASGRAFPDVAAMGTNVEIVFAGETGTVGGTSASSPIFASVIALLNDELVARGKHKLGFLNPLLYTIGSFGLKDITNGTAPGCGTQGFPAKAGWDPITGLGTPNYPALRTIVGL